MGGQSTSLIPNGSCISSAGAGCLDSWEGGEAYRMAVYGFDLHGMPVRNLIRHKREYPSSFDANYSPQIGRPPGTDQASQATDDDYELRRARTPVPTFVAEAVEAHLARIYSREVHREGPERLLAWWRNVDGRGASVDQWMSGTIAPLLLVLGQLDIIIDHPPLPRGEEVRTRADEVRLGLDTCVASYILPENLVWWTLDRLGGYDECLVREVQDDGRIQWRYWDARLLGALRSVGRCPGRTGRARLRPRADCPALRPPPASLPQHRPASVRVDRRAPARVLQP